LTSNIRFDWGSTGAAVIAADADVAVVVDVLSFTTTLSVALDVGTTVLPYRFNDDGAAAYAKRHHAVLALGRSHAGTGQLSLSPASIRSAPAVQRLVLPSPNGSTISYQLGSQGRACVASCLRNTAAVVDWLCTRYARGTAAIAVIAAGERWPDGDLRPAVEDLWGAGAIIAGLAAAGWVGLSPEADLARVGFLAIRDQELEALLACASGRELVELGYRADVEIAAEVNASIAVPVLDGHEFVPASASSQQRAGR
jgi:2-phosphosulfolactate phosphatase